MGAIYLDSGLEVASRLTERWFSPLIATALPGQDFKTSLQEFTHARYKVPPAYHLMAESGPGHARHFQVEVRLQDRPLARGKAAPRKKRSSGRLAGPSKSCRATARRPVRTPPHRLRLRERQSSRAPCLPSVALVRGPGIISAWRCR